MRKWENITKIRTPGLDIAINVPDFGTKQYPVLLPRNACVFDKRFGRDSYRWCCREGGKIVFCEYDRREGMRCYVFDPKTGRLKVVESG